MNIDLTWLIRPVSLTALDRQDWGLIRNEWEALRSQVVAGDELWEYGTPKHLQKPLALELGIALKRGDKVIGHVATIQS